MYHPEAVARLLREKSTWREPFETRGSRAFDAVDWRDAAAALAGCSSLAYAAFQYRHSEEPPTRELVQHLLEIAAQALGESAHATPVQLVELLLREERAPESQRVLRHRAAALGMSPHLFRKYLASPYGQVATELEILISDAWRVARDRIAA